MGNRNSESRRENRWNTRKWQQFAENHDESGRGAAAIEQNRRVSQVSRKKDYESITYSIIVGENGWSRGFKIEENSLMIIDITNPVLREQMLPEGSIIREIDGISVYNYDQFCTHTANKSKYTMTVLTPKTTGVWKVCPSKTHRKVVVHKETLVVQSTTIPNFPREVQIIKSVNGHPVRSYTEYESLIGAKTKFFVTVVPVRRDDISATSITVFLDTVSRTPESISDHDLWLIRMAVEESIDEVNSELNMRMQNLPPGRSNYGNNEDLGPVIDHPLAASVQVVEWQKSQEPQLEKKKKSRRKRRGRRR